MTKTIETAAYPIIISDDIGKYIDDFISTSNYSSTYILMDENIMADCWPILSKESETLRNAEILLIEAGESQKDIAIATQLWQALTENEADRSSLLINFGGGVITDLGGFIASTFKRGMDFINIPTSLLAMVDASVGGKTGINLQHHKNQIGLFSEPKRIFIQSRFLETLDERQLKNGYAEMLKHGLITDANLWDSLKKIKNIDTLNILPYIEKSIQIKVDIVKKDPLEKGFRKALNFGHSLGHLLESFSLQNDENPLYHGEAVAIGMMIESYISTQKSGLPLTEFDDIKNYLGSIYDKYEIPDSFWANFEHIINQDKKKEGKKLNFTFVSKIGAALINQDCTIEEIKQAIIYYKESC
ncbi:MAG: 3-dehydroquinate synthase [Bacteroidales bacterium]|nr:3-dehydroquinate synthase [Bacteroidales bacterium]